MMAKPVDIDIRVPLSYEGDGEGAGWVQIKVHVDDVGGMSQVDQHFLLELLDRVHAFVKAVLVPESQDAGKFREQRKDWDT